MEPLQIFVITLKDSAARQERVRRELAKTNFQWSFLDAVDGRNLSISRAPYNPKKVKRLLGFELTPKEIGCYLSHMKAWEACVNENIDTLIFEDDFVIGEKFEEIVKFLLSAKLNWDILRFQALCECQDIVLQEFGLFRWVRNVRDPLGATAYLINPTSALQLLRQSEEIFEPLDHYLEHVEKHGLIMSAVKPYPITVTDPTRLTSTITDRPDRKSVRGLRKKMRSIARFLDRIFSSNPYFPK